MNYDEAVTVYQDIKQTKCTSLVDDLVETAVRYARIRADYMSANIDQRAEMEDKRTRTHNALIDCCNILARNMDDAGEDVAWRQTLGADRKVIGDFACYLHCIIGISVR